MDPVREWQSLGKMKVRSELENPRFVFRLQENLFYLAVKGYESLIFHISLLFKD